MSPDQARAILESIKYRPGVYLRLVNGLTSLRWAVEIGGNMVDADYPQDTVRLRMAVDVDLDRLTIEGLLEFVFKLILEVEIHEAGEFFQYKGHKPYDPHGGDTHAARRAAAEAVRNLPGLRPYPGDDRDRGLRPVREFINDAPGSDNGSGAGDKDQPVLPGAKIPTKALLEEFDRIAGDAAKRNIRTAIDRQRSLMEDFYLRGKY